MPLRGSIKVAQSRVRETEDLIYAICANVEIKSDHKDDFKNRYEMFGGALQVKNVLAGVVVITLERIFSVNSALGTVSFKEIDIKDIRSIDEMQAVMGTGELRIHGLTETFSRDTRCPFRSKI